MTLSDVVSRLEYTKRKTFKDGTEGYVARCPGPNHQHGDKSMALALFIGDNDWIQLKCQGGCSKDQILAAIGLKNEDLLCKSYTPLSGPTAVYRYRNADGSEHFEKCRYQNGSKKTFSLRHKLPDGSYSKDLHALNGWAKTLYRLPEVIQAIKEGKTVYVNEGEKACDLMAQNGLCGTCQPLGADERSPGSKWLRDHSEALLGAKVVIVADRDDTGVAYSRYLASELVMRAESVRIVQSKTENPKDDAYDHLKAGYGPEDFVPLAEPTAKGSGLRAFSEIEQQFVDWLWRPYFPLGGMTICVGDPGVGKSTFAFALAACVTRGEGGGGFPRQEPGDVLLYCLEDDAARVIKSKLMNDGADMTRVFDGTYDPKYNPEGLEQPIDAQKMLRVIEQARKMPNLKLVIFDPVVEWFPAGKNTASSTDVREVTRLFRQLAEDQNIAVLLLGHPNKSTGSSLLYRVSGSIDFTAVVRSGLYATKLEDGTRALMHFKQNWGGQGKAIGFTIDEEGRFGWAGSLDLTEEMLNTVSHEKPITAKERSECWEWVLETLREGAMDSNELIAGAKAAGFSRATIFRAKKDHPSDVRCRKEGTSWTWTLNAGWEGDDYDPFARA